MLSAGRSFQRYHLLRLIGKGGMGEVYLAEDRRIHRQVAIKLIRIEESQDDHEETKDTLRLFLREATAIARLDHPAILALYDYGEETIDGVHFAYLITPYRAAGSLTNWLRHRMRNQRSQSLTLHQVAHIIEEAGSALQYAHDHQVVHQDVKPANFLIRNAETDEYPRLQLADFGIARLTGATSHASQQVRGTPTYMAPEQWAGQAVFASDQYALAIMAYELITGNAPFRGAPMRVMYAHLQDAPQPPRELNPLVSPLVEKALLRSLAKKPEERFPSVADFARAFQGAVQNGSEHTPFRPFPSMSSTPQRSDGAFATSKPRGNDIRATLAISASEARSGTLRVIRLPGGRSVSVQIPPGAQQGQVLTLDNQGEFSPMGGAAGTLYLTLSVVEPQTPAFSSPTGTVPPWPMTQEHVTPVQSNVASPAPSSRVMPTQPVTPQSAGSVFSPSAFPTSSTPPSTGFPLVTRETPSGPFPPVPRSVHKRQRRSPLLVVGMISLLAILLGAGSLGGYYARAGRWPWVGNQPNGANSSSPTTALPAAPLAQQTYRLGISGGLPSLDPAAAYDATSLQAVQMIFTGLVQFNDQGQVVDQIAQSHDVSADGLTYTFHLRSHLQFSDGTPLTALNVAYSIDRALSPSLTSVNPGTTIYLGLIKDASQRMNGQIASLIGRSINVLDATTISLLLSQPAAFFLNALASPTAFIVEESMIDKWGSKWTDHLSENGGQGGNGPFKVQRYDPTTSIIFVPNATYYGPQPRLQRIVFTFYTTTTASYLAYQAKQIDLTSIPPTYIYRTQAEQRVKEYHRDPALIIRYIAMNYLYKPFDNLLIRQAFAIALNRDTINASLAQGNNIPTCHILPQDTPAYNPQLHCPAGTSTRGDPTKARALFAQGLQTEGLTTASFPHITLTYSSEDTAITTQVSAMIQTWQQVLGVTLTAQALSSTPFFNAINATTCTQAHLATCQNQGLAMWLIGWAGDYPDPQDWTTFQFAKGALNNEQNYGQNLCSCAAEQQQVQQLLERADTDAGPDRISLYQQAEQQLVNDVAWLPISQDTISYLLSPSMIGFSYNVTGAIPPDDWGHIYIAAHG